METQEQFDNQSPQALVSNPETQPTSPNSQYEIPDTKSFPWMKLAGFIFLFLAIINIGLLYFYLSGKKSGLADQQVGTEDNQGFLLTKPNYIKRRIHNYVFKP